MAFAAVLGLFEDPEFDYAERRRWLKSHWHWTVPAAVVYLGAVYYGQRLMRDQKAYNLKKPLFLWNFVLAIFSTLGTIRTVPELLSVLREGGLHGAICDEGGLGRHGPFAQWVWLFCVSKAVELIDTLFLVLRKRPVVFIHWYHHVTVLIFTWYTNSQAISAGRWYLVMNYCVHSIMYAYYAIRTLGFLLPRFIPMCITGLQVTQMLVGFWVTLYAAARVWDGPSAPGGRCQTTATNTIAGLTLYGSYFVLFFRLFLRSYFAKGAKKMEYVVNGNLANLGCKLNGGLTSNRLIKNGNHTMSRQHSANNHMNGSSCTTSSSVTDVKNLPTGGQCNGHPPSYDTSHLKCN